MESRISLIQANLKAWIEKSVPRSNLDSNLKKNTAFIKKCRASLNSDNRVSLLKDISSLSLEKYISEVVSAISEGILKCKTSPNINTAVEVISALHQRFPDSFTSELFEVLRKSLAINKNTALTGVDKEKEESNRVLKHRTILKVVTEIWLSGVFWGIENGITKFPEAKDVAKKMIDNLNLIKEDTKLDKNYFVEGPMSQSWNPALKNNHLGIVYHSIKAQFSVDRDKFTCIPLAVSFLKSFGHDVLRILPKSQNIKQNNEDGQADLNVIKNDLDNSISVSILTNEQVEALRELFVSYFKDLSKNLIRDHKTIQKEERINNERFIARGEVNDEVKVRYENNFKAYEKNLQYMQTMSDYLDLDMPELPNDTNNSNNTNIVINEFGFNKGDGENVHEGGPWEDEDAKAFYEKILDLKSLVPGILLNIDSNDKNSQEDEKEVQNPKSPVQVTSPINSPEIEIDEIEDELDDSVKLEEDNEDNTEEKTTASAQMSAFLIKLQSMGNRDLIDQAAVEFCYINNKASRKRLIRSLIDVPQKRLDLLSYYSRFIATLNPYFPDIGKAVEMGVEKEFRGLLKKKTSNVGGSMLLERRVKNIRYLAELTKFSLIPNHFAFFILKSLLDNFLNPGNIEILSNFLEVCGRFLLKSPETSERMAVMIDIMMKKKTSSHLNERLEMMIENAYYQCNPPEQTTIVKKVLTPMQKFIKHLIMVESANFSLDKLTKIVRRLAWDDEAIYNFIFKTITKIHKHNFANVPFIAALVASLFKYQPNFVEEVVDQVLEDINVGLEENNYKFNQKRISQVKFLAELFNYRVVNASIIINTLTLIVAFGYPYGRPSKTVFNPFDLPNDCFRITLCCVILDTCGKYFNTAKLIAKLDEFLILFQLYILSKPNVPIDVQFSINDTFELLRPKLTMFNSYEEAEIAYVNVMNSKLQNGQVQNKSNTPDQPISDNEEDGETSSESDDSDSENEKDDEELEEEYESDNNLEGDKIVLLNQLKKEQDESLRIQEEEDFEKEYQAMLALNFDSRKISNKVAVLDVPIPMKLLDKNKQAEIEEDGGNIAFSLLTKRGNKQQVRTVAVPSENTLAVQTLNKQKAERIEQQQLKKIVLGYDENANLEAKSQDKPFRGTGFKINLTKEKKNKNHPAFKSKVMHHDTNTFKQNGNVNLDKDDRDAHFKSNGKTKVTQTFDLADLMSKSSKGTKGRG